MFFVCVSMHMCTLVHTCEYGYLQGPELWGPRQLELQAVVSCVTWVLATKHESMSLL